MLTSSKRLPAFTDTDAMPFGQYKGWLFQDIPPKYLKWLYNDMKTRFGKTNWNDSMPVEFKESYMVFNYIWNSQDAIAQELGELL